LNAKDLAGLHTLYSGKPFPVSPIWQGYEAGFEVLPKRPLQCFDLCQIFAKLKPKLVKVFPNRLLAN